MKRYPKSPEVASTYGLVLYRLGRLDDAEKALKVAAPIVGSDLDTAYVFALMAASADTRTRPSGCWKPG